MIEPNQATRPRWCPRCRGRMRVSPNPYYGVGLAVHQHLSTCPRCGYVEFVPGAPRRADPPATGAPSPPSLGHRLLSLAARWFAMPH